MSTRLFTFFLLGVALSMPCNDLVAQQNAGSIESHESIHLRKRKKVINIYTADYFGLTTATDTVKYFGEKTHSYKLIKADTNSFVLRKPLGYKDTIIQSNRLSVLNGREYIYGTPFKTGKNYYVSIVLVDSYEYKTVPVKNITSIQYPPDAGNTLGCFSCAIIPVYNIFYFINLRKRWHPKNFQLEKWRLEISK